MKLQILFLQQTRLLSNPCNIRYIQQRKLVYATKINLRKLQKEPWYFVVEEMHKYLDHGRNCLKEKKCTIEMKNWMGFYQLVGSNSYVAGITKYLRTLLVDDKFPERLNSLKGKLAFRNAIMNLETKTFREGIQWDDYVTETIPRA